MARFVARAELARMAKVSRGAITKACSASLREACSGKRVDLDHPSVVAYLKKHGVEATPAPSTSAGPATEPLERRPPKRRRAPPVTHGPPAGPESEFGQTVPWEEIERLSHLSLDVLVKKFGTALAFKDWLDARKKIGEIREKELKNLETDGRLISRDLVRTHVIGAIDAGNRLLLSDVPKTLARRLYGFAKAGEPVEKAEAMVRETISSVIKPVKASASRKLRNV